MYVDDMCLLYFFKNIFEVRVVIQEDFINIIKWVYDNGIILNVNKIKIMYVYLFYNLVVK